MVSLIRGLAVLACLVAAGCSTPNVNPPAPRAHTGYVDFYTASSLDLSWEVKRADPKTGELKTVFGEFEPVPGAILRLATPPGSNRFQVWFINKFTEGPVSVAVPVENGKITPVRVTLKPSGKTSFQRKVYGFHGSAKGYGRGTKIVTGQAESYQIEAVPELAEGYKPQQQMRYFAQPAEE